MRMIFLVTIIFSCTTLITYSAELTPAQKKQLPLFNQEEFDKLTPAQKEDYVERMTQILKYKQPDGMAPVFYIVVFGAIGLGIIVGIIGCIPSCRDEFLYGTWEDRGKLVAGIVFGVMILLGVTLAVISEATYTGPSYNSLDQSIRMDRVDQGLKEVQAELNQTLQPYREQDRQVKEAMILLNEMEKEHRNKERWGE